MKNEALEKILLGQRFAVLATQNGGEPYGSLVAFVPSEDFSSLFFATIRETHKFENMKRDPRVALLADDRMNRVSDLQNAVAVTAVGEAREIRGPEREKAVPAYLARHPDLKGFLEDPRCALMEVSIKKYVIVSAFRNVEELAVP